MQSIKCQNNSDRITRWIGNWCCHVGIHASYFCQTVTYSWYEHDGEECLCKIARLAPLVINVLCITDGVRPRGREARISRLMWKTWMMFNPQEPWRLGRDLWIVVHAGWAMQSEQILDPTDILHCVLRGATCDGSINQSTFCNCVFINKNYTR